MASTSRRFLLAATLALPLGCGGSPAADPQTPATGAEVTSATSGPLAPAEELSLTPVPAPAGLIAVGRWKQPGATADTLMAKCPSKYEGGDFDETSHDEMKSAMK